MQLKYYYSVIYTYRPVFFDREFHNFIVILWHRTQVTSLWQDWWFYFKYNDPFTPTPTPPSPPPFIPHKQLKVSFSTNPTVMPCSVYSSWPLYPKVSSRPLRHTPLIHVFPVWHFHSDIFPFWHLPSNISLWHSPLTSSPLTSPSDISPLTSPLTLPPLTFPPLTSPLSLPSSHAKQLSVLFNLPTEDQF